ncbi:MAG TPA: hypothetical protein VI997_10290, partial [Candidatus Thermoplasmatota archaeon]|nr:hypothetical protein [Candidatus Thermoplasmatota archaeon]
LSRLEHEWARVWKEGEPFAPSIALGEVPARVGSVVEVRGVDAGMTEYRGKMVLRLESEGRALPVLVPADPGLTGQSVRIVGKIVQEHGLTYLAAEKVAPLGRVA